jgi:hypothetical protein
MVPLEKDDNRSKTWQATTNRFVGFFDMLGFKDFCHRSPHEKVLDRARLIKQAVAQLNLPDADEPNRLRAILFSDSVLVVTEDLSESSADQILVAGEWLIYHFVSEGILAKGVLKAGLFTADFDDSIFCGRPLIDAFVLHDELDACAALLHHTAERGIWELGPGTKVSLPNRVPVALKNGNVNHCVIDWRANLKPSEAIGKLEKLYTTVSGTSRRYVDNTLAYTKLLGDYA